MKIDCSKLSNKDDLVILIVSAISIVILIAVVLLQLRGESFLSGVVAGVTVCKWKCWIYRQVDVFLDKHWAEK